MLIVEGKFNVISIWQEAHRLDLPIDTISIGGGSIGDERLSSLVKLVARYRGCAAWLDRVEIAQKVGSYLERAMLLKSLGGRDANELAQSEELAGIVKAIYQRFAQARERITTTQAEKEPTHGDLLNDAGWLIEKLSGEGYVKGGKLYLELEDAVVNGELGAAYSIHAQIRMLGTGQAWDDLAIAAQGEQGNALYI